MRSCTPSELAIEGEAKQLVADPESEGHAMSSVETTVVALRDVCECCAGAYAPVVLAKWGTTSGGPGHRSLAYVLGNMLSAGGKHSLQMTHIQLGYSPRHQATSLGSIQP